MDIKTVADLGRLAALCRKKGIESIKVTSESVEFKLTEALPARTRRAKKVLEEEDAEDTPRAPTEEEILFWSSGGISAAGGST